MYKSSNKKQQKKQACHSSEDGGKTIFITDDIEFDDKNYVSYLEIIRLPNPQHGNNTLYVYDSKKRTIKEVLKFNQPFRSWFIGNEVCSDGSMSLSTPIDPLFLILPYLSRCKMSTTLDQLIHDDNYPDSMKLEFVIDKEQLSLIANEKDCSGFVVWKYSEEKTLAWLSLKVNRLAKFLENKNFNVNILCAVSQTFVQKKKDEFVNYLRYAHGIINDYINSDLSEKLSSYLKIPAIDNSIENKRKTNEIEPDEIKRIKLEQKQKDIAAEFNSDKKNKVVRKNPKQTSLLKAASGCKNISSFFKKKE